MDSVLIVLILVAAGFFAQFLVQRGMTSRYDYQCDKCGTTFSLTPGRASIAPHRPGGSKFVRCPNCSARSWVSPVPK